MYALFEHAAAVYNALVMRSAGDRLVITLAVASFTKKLTREFGVNFRHRHSHDQPMFKRSDSGNSDYVCSMLVWPDHWPLSIPIEFLSLRVLKQTCDRGGNN